MMLKGEIEKDRKIIIDEGLSDYEDYTITSSVKESINKIFRVGTENY